MRVLMIAWEYPPHVVGGLGKHVAELIPPLSEMPGLDLHLITPRWGDSDPLEHEGRVTIHRVDPPVSEGEFFPHAVRTNLILEEYAQALWQDSGPFDLIHVHDWLVAFVGIALKKEHKTPLLSTIHATERGRGRGGLASEQARSIDEVERRLAAESWRVIACSDYMVDEISDYFDCSSDKIDVIPNGVDPSRFDALEGTDLSEFRLTYAPPDTKIVFYVGRVVFEKGLQVLVRAMPLMLDELPGVKAVVAGKGPELEALRTLASSLDVTENVHFTGFISDEDRDRLFKIADCAVFPSLYEPFGIVALEAMAARCPVVVTEVGGLKDVVRHSETGLTVYPDNPESLAWGILQTLQDPKSSADRVDNAYRAVLEEFNWERIAEQTVDVYRTIIAERTITVW